MDSDENNLMNNQGAGNQSAIVELLAPEGLGFGEGGISVKKQLEEGIVTEEVPRHVYELLMEDAEAFKKVEVPDDGCGDGRPWHKVIQMVPDGKSGKKLEFYNTSRLRAKVFGGGLVVAASMWRTIQGAPEGDQTLGMDRAFVAEGLRSRGFSHGAHSDDRAAGDDCGCGAIDNYPKITANALRYRSEITSVIKALYGDEFEENVQAVETVFSNYESLVGSQRYFSDASGKKSMEQILNSGAVVKELYGRHIEETIVINDVRGTTLDQQHFTQTVKNASVNKPRTVQAFSVDIWRGREIADVVTDIAQQYDPGIDAENVRKLAYADFLVRTIAVACTLTAGDLPVYRRRKTDISLET
jgi:hypothetical protein